VWKSVTVLYLVVVTTCKWLINPLLIRSLSLVMDTRDNIFILSYSVRPDLQTPPFKFSEQNYGSCVFSTSPMRAIRTAYSLFSKEKWSAYSGTNTHLWRITDTRGKWRTTSVNACSCFCSLASLIGTSDCLNNILAYTCSWYHNLNPSPTKILLRFHCFLIRYCFYTCYLRPCSSSSG
jgi:hypothetical protein